MWCAKLRLKRKGKGKKKSLLQNGENKGELSFYIRHIFFVYSLIGRIGIRKKKSYKFHFFQFIYCRSFTNKLILLNMYKKFILLNKYNNTFYLFNLYLIFIQHNFMLFINKIFKNIKLYQIIIYYNNYRSQFACFFFNMGFNFKIYQNIGIETIFIDMNFI